MQISKAAYNSLPCFQRLFHSSLIVIAIGINGYWIRGYNSVKFTTRLSIIKTKKQISKKEFDTVKTFRAIKEKISKDISCMTLAQIQEYLRQH